MSDLYGFLAVLVLIGLATGALTGLTGASGMSILISALLMAGVGIREVIGLTFVITLVNAIVAIGPYWKTGHVDGRVGVLVAGPAVIAVMVGHQFANRVEPSSLTGVMVVCLFVIGLRFVVAPDERERAEATADQRPNKVMLVLMGCVAGLVMGIMGGGGAVFIAIAFILLFKMEAKTAIGTSIFVMGLAAIPGVVSHALSQTIEVSFIVAILASSIPAAFISSWYANRISKRLVKRLLGVYLVVISTLLFCRSFF